MVMNTRSEEEESIKDDFRVITGDTNIAAAPAAARSLQSCPTLCDPIDGSQARTLEWVAISFSSA